MRKRKNKKDSYKKYFKKQKSPVQQLDNFGLPKKFKNSVNKECERISEEITEEEINNRSDFRNKVTFTIDPFDARDFDDALSVEVLQDNTYEIGVHIADVTHYIKENSLLDKEAYRRSTSVYLVDRVVPMIPERLSNFICSLRPDEDKLTYSVIFNINQRGKIIDYWIDKTIINSNHRFTYEEAQEILDNGNGIYYNELKILYDISQIFRKKRQKAGSINFEKNETRFKYENNELKPYIKEPIPTNHLIEEFMLLANKYVGKKHSNKTFIYRIHEDPNKEKLENLKVFVVNLGYNLDLTNKGTLIKSMNKLLSDVKGKPEESMIEMLAVRTMAKAKYSVENVGHYGLGFSHYSHFTSPIRRYPDMIAHRLLFDYENKEPSKKSNIYEKNAEHCSTMEYEAVKAERLSIKQKQAEYLSKHIGNVYEGIIVSVKDFGLFVELIDNKIEGLIHIKNINDDHYKYEENKYRLIGKHNGKIYQIGDKVNIVVNNVDLIQYKIDFVFL